MKKILILEDNETYSKNLAIELRRVFDFDLDILDSAKDIAKDNVKKYDLIIADVFLNDSNGEYLEELSTFDVPIMLMTAFGEDPLKNLNYKEKNIIDFILKTDSNKFEHIIDKIKILNYIDNIKILIIDDSKTSQFINLKAIKELYPFSDVVLAKDGIDGLKKVEENPNIKLILTDFEMPKMDGIEFTKKLRIKYGVEDKIVIAISANTDTKTSSRFLKTGANDFLNKPFNKEELKCRIDNNVKIFMLLDEIKTMAYKDELTKLYNRRYFFEIAKKTFATKIRENLKLSIIMLDIDHFKKFNDTYGHQTGDLVLQEFAKTLTNNLRTNDILARYGGEEFIVMAIGCDVKTAFLVAEKQIRQKIEDLEVEDETHGILKFTVSAGVSDEGNSLDEMIKNADKMLYKAKEKRNQVYANFLG